MDGLPALFDAPAARRPALVGPRSDESARRPVPAGAGQGSPVPGMPADLLEHHRPIRHERKPQAGAGLALAIAAAIAAGHHGRLDISHRARGGTDMTLHLPDHTQPTTTPGPTPKVQDGRSDRGKGGEHRLALPLRGRRPLEPGGERLQCSAACRSSSSRDTRRQGVEWLPICTVPG